MNNKEKMEHIVSHLATLDIPCSEQEGCVFFCFLQTKIGDIFFSIELETNRAIAICTQFQTNQINKKIINYFNNLGMFCVKEQELFTVCFEFRDEAYADFEKMICDTKRVLETKLFPW